MRITPSRITTLVALPFVLVLVADVVDTWLERRHGERNVLVEATVRFEPRDRVVRLVRLTDSGHEHGVSLGSGWTGPVGGGLGVAGNGAVLHVANLYDGPMTLLVETRSRGAAATGGRLRVAAGDVPLGSVDLDRTWREGALEIPGKRLRGSAVDLWFEADPGVEALVRRVAMTADRSKGIDDLDRADGLEHDARDGWLTVSRPGRVVVEIDAAPVPSRLVARVRFLPPDGRLPVGHVLLAVSPASAGSSGPAAVAELDATQALWRDLSLDVPLGEPVELVVTVPTLGHGDILVLESVWRRPD